MGRVGHGLRDQRDTWTAPGGRHTGRWLGIATRSLCVRVGASPDGQGDGLACHGLQEGQVLRGKGVGGIWKGRRRVRTEPNRPL